MRLGLGNTLVNNGLSNPDLLSLDLQFAADKGYAADGTVVSGTGQFNITSRRGPAAKFTRASGATEVGPDGLIRYAPENLMLNSGNISLMTRLSVPVATSQTGGPLGSYYTLGVDATSGFHIYRNSGVTPAASAPSMMWVLAKRGTAKYLRIGGGAASTFDWDALIFSSISTSHSAGVAVAVGDGWYWLPILRGQTEFIDLAPSSSSGMTFSYNETANITVEVAAIQVSRSELLQNAAPTYIPTTTAYAYGPRFDHDPVTLECKGLLIEETRDNFITNSNLYSSASATNITATTISGSSPLSGFNQIRELSLTGTGLTSLQYTIAAAGTTNKTLSVFVKKPASGAAPYFTIGFATSNAQYAGIQLTMSGASPVISVTSTAAGGFAVVSSSIQAFSNDWYRVSVVASGVLSLCYPTLYPSNAVWNGTSDIRQTLTASGSNIIYVFGAQLEAGSFATNYIPTAALSLIRSADFCSITGTAFTSFYNQSEGTFAFKADTLLVGNSSVVYTANDGTNNNTILCLPGSSSFVIITSGSTQASINHGNFVTNVASNQASGYKLNDFASSRNGGTVITDNIGTVPTVTTLNIGGNTSSTAQIQGHIAYIRYFKKRLPNAKLQTLST